MGVIPGISFLGIPFEFESVLDSDERVQVYWCDDTGCCTTMEFPSIVVEDEFEQEYLIEPDFQKRTGP